MIPRRHPFGFIYIFRFKFFCFVSSIELCLIYINNAKKYVKDFHRELFPWYLLEWTVVHWNYPYIFEGNIKEIIYSWWCMNPGLYHISYQFTVWKKLFSTFTLWWVSWCDISLSVVPPLYLLDYLCSIFLHLVHIVLYPCYCIIRLPSVSFIDVPTNDKSVD